MRFKLQTVFPFFKSRSNRSHRAQSRKRRATPTIVLAPELTQLWHSLRMDFFPEAPALDDYVIGWSTRRQRRTLASCEVRRHIVRVAKELKDPLFGPYLEPLLYHEMCHAALGTEVGYYRGKRAWHGPRFKALEKRHPGIRTLDAWIKGGGWSYAVRRARALEANGRRARAK